MNGGPESALRCHRLVGIWETKHPDTGTPGVLGNGLLPIRGFGVHCALDCSDQVDIEVDTVEASQRAKWRRRYRDT